MAKIYSKERSKYGNITGQIIIWPVQYDSINSSIYDKHYGNIFMIDSKGNLCQYDTRNNYKPTIIRKNVNYRL